MRQLIGQNEKLPADEQFYQAPPHVMDYKKKRILGEAAERRSVNGSPRGEFLKILYRRTFIQVFSIFPSLPYSTTMDCLQDIS